MYGYQLPLFFSMYFIIVSPRPVLDSALFVMIARYAHVRYPGIRFVHLINARITLIIATGLKAVIVHGMSIIQRRGIRKYHIASRTGNQVLYYRKNS
jgi:hypothetical protein